MPFVELAARICIKWHTLALAHGTVAAMQKVQDVDADDMLTSNGVMELAQISRRTLERWVADGKLPFQKLPGSGERRYLRADVEYLITPSPTSSEAQPDLGAQPAGQTPEETTGGRPVGQTGEVRDPLAADSTRTSPAIDPAAAR